jgi:Ca2+-transporting ATPase
MIWHSTNIEDIISSLGTSQDNGLQEVEAQARLEQHGKNEIQSTEHRPWYKILVNQFKSPIVYLLIFAAAMSFYFNEWLDGIAILIVILINAVIGFYMEFQAGRSMEALQKLSSVPAKVLRDGSMKEIDSSNIVPGDLVYLEAGDMVTADARIVRLTHLQINESSLTGESVPVDKNITIVAESTPLAEQHNMLFKGTFVTKGNAWAVVTKTGMHTELGKIANLVQQSEQSATPLEKKLQEFSKKLIWITVALVVIIFFSGWFLGHQLLEMINTSIALAVAAIPEGLPIVATLGLARGMLKMAKHNVIVKKLSAVETLGGTSVICTDKTGTLTENRMTVKSVETVESGTLITACVLCNTSDVSDKGDEIGDPLETALLRYAIEQKQPLSEIRSAFPKVNEEPFSSETKRMITVHKNSQMYVSYVKGAVEEIIAMCEPSSRNTEFVVKAEALASSGYKVLGFAYQKANDMSIKTSGYELLGVIGLIDPPRPDVFDAISECKTAGIKVVMITGDHPQTAKEIARQLGLIASTDEAAIKGSDMRPYEVLSAEDKQLWVNSKVFARVTPAQKLDLIRVYQENGQVVGMTGDGVNDAPALKKSDIGIAMGQRGTQVAQDVADMVLKDDSFASIVTAIRQGRIIFSNIRKFVIFLLSCNLSELFTIAVTAVSNLHFQLLPLQILFINLITDVLPALALGMTTGDVNIMRQKPRAMNQPIIEIQHWKAILFYSAVIAASSLGAVTFSHYTFHESEGWNPLLCNNILFFTIIGSQLLHVFNMNASGSNFFRSEVIRNRYVWYALVINLVLLVALYEITVIRTVLQLYPLSIYDWMIVCGFSLSSMVINQIAKTLNIVKQ